MAVSPSQVVMVFVMIVIGASLAAPLASTIIDGANSSSSGGQWLWSNNASFGGVANVSGITGATLALYGLITMFFVIVVIMVAVRFIQANS